MSRTKLKADNAEQLAEIIKAIQRGEEPTQESIRRKTGIQGLQCGGPLCKM